MYEGEYCNQPPGRVTKVTLPPPLIAIRKIVGESIDAFAIINHFLTPTSSPTGESISRKGTARATIMAKQTITISRVGYYAPDNTVSLILTSNVPAIVKDDSGAFIVGENDTIYINRKAFSAQVAGVSELFDKYLSVREEAMGKPALNAVFKKAKLVVERELHQPGEVLGEYMVENQMFTTQVVSIEFAPDAVAGMKDKIAAAF